jgi:mitogen-activated protein kinase 15
LESIHKKYVLYQLLVGTKYLHEMGLIHRDLKPSNILLDSNCSSKICDFGLARLVKSYDKETSIMTEGVATRWYRSPEVLLGSTSYGYEADIWSIGCIMAEILIKNPMFPGSSTINQLEKILQFTGKPTQEDIASIDCEGAEKFIWQCGNIKQKSVK